MKTDGTLSPPRPAFLPRWSSDARDLARVRRGLKQLTASMSTRDAGSVCKSLPLLERTTELTAAYLRDHGKDELRCVDKIYTSKAGGAFNPRLLGVTHGVVRGAADLAFSADPKRWSLALKRWGKSGRRYAGRACPTLVLQRPADDHLCEEPKARWCDDRKLLFDREEDPLVSNDAAACASASCTLEALNCYRPSAWLTPMQTSKKPGLARWLRRRHDQSSPRLEQVLAAIRCGLPMLQQGDYFGFRPHGDLLCTGLGVMTTRDFKRAMQAMRDILGPMTTAAAWTAASIFYSAATTRWALKGHRINRQKEYCMLTKTIARLALRPVAITQPALAAVDAVLLRCAQQGLGREAIRHRIKATLASRFEWRYFACQLDAGDNYALRE